MTQPTEPPPSASTPPPSFPKRDHFTAAAWWSIGLGVAALVGAPLAAIPDVRLVLWLPDFVFALLCILVPINGLVCAGRALADRATVGGSLGLVLTSRTGRYTYRHTSRV